ncbi:MAG: hypothetical protein ISS16_06865 [Ignavibacteria bacterium]|nr:hypothetical protein [Ignavibacteria bacterium]
MNLSEEIKFQQTKIPKEYYSKYIEAFESFIKGIGSSKDMIKIITPVTSKITQSVNEDVEIVGRILRYHLEMESILNEYIKYHYSDSMDIEILLNLSFYKKIALIKKVPFFEQEFEMIVEGLIELNNLRNKLAHNINFNILSFKTEKMNKIIDILKERKDLLTPTINLDEVDLLNTVRHFCFFSLGILVCFYGNANELLVKSYKQFVDDFLLGIANNN